MNPGPQDNGFLCYNCGMPWITSQQPFSALTLSVCIATSLVFSLNANAEIVKRTLPDGRVEYTNVPATTNKPRGDTIYKYRNKLGVLSFSDQKPRGNLNFEVMRFDCFACQAQPGVNWQTTPLNLQSYRDQTRSLSRVTGIDEALIRAVIHAESAFNAKAISSKGATGLMQLMPATAAELGVENRLDPAENIAGGSRYLEQLLALYQGDEQLATAAYNAGPGAVSRYAGIPPYTETQNYVSRVQILRKRYALALD